MANRNPMMNQQPMMANLNSPVSMGAMMNNMTMGGRPPMGQPPNRSMPGGGWGGPYGGISHAVEKAKRDAGVYDVDEGLLWMINNQLQQDDIQEGIRWDDQFGWEEWGLQQQKRDKVDPFTWEQKFPGQLPPVHPLWKGPII